MKGKRVQVQKWAYKFTNPTVMKFQPLQDFQEPNEDGKKSIVNRIRTFFSPPSKQKIRTPTRRLNSINSVEPRFSPRKQAPKKATLRFVKRLTNEHVLIGNQDQLDAMCISGIIHDFVDTQYLWSLNIKRAILHVTIDYKKSYIILLPEREVLVYKFDSKLIIDKPVFIHSIKLSKDVRFVQVIKQGYFILCYSTEIQVYSIQDGKGIRLTLQKKYQLPKENVLKLFQIPLPYENILNIFFAEQIPDSASLSLWNVQAEFNEKQVRMSKAQKIYEIPMHLRNSIRLQNYSKDIYFINLGQQIYAVRKGYIIDSANVNIKTGYNYLKYISNQKLIHVSAFKVEVYSFTVDTSLNPPHIVLNSTDSIQIPNISEKLQYLDSVEILGENFAVFYQTKDDENRYTKGEIKYGFIVTHLIKMEDKIKNLLPQEIKNHSIETIEEKADMVKKMGLETKDVYLRLWNNSQRTQVQDFRILLDTLDYETIKIEIQKKLKKNSMNFRQVLLLEQGCLSMLSQNIFGPTNTKQDLKNYFISHLLIRKLQLYKQITLLQRKDDDTSQLMINIQNYNYYKTVDIKSMLSQLIGRYCNEDKVDIMKIRTIIKFFKFPLRMMYQDWLTEIIVATKKKFLKILQAIPELLPYQHRYDEKQAQDPTLFEGIWKQINIQEWQRHLYIDTVSTIDNRNNLAEVCSNVWYKRYWMTQHDFINNTKKEIQEIHDLNRQDVMFYLAIDRIFDQVKEYVSLRPIIDYIQDHYEKMPQHIYGKIFLYRKLYEHFRENQKISKIQEKIDSFGQFLKLKDQDIFKAMFNYEKVKKGFILKEMKPLYMKLAGSEIFNEGLLNYFASKKSQISDIKYLLNRMNNQKREFHEQNEGIYQVLVRGMQLKLKLGSTEDIPIDQVLIYIQNIPLSPNNPIMKDLDIMRLINEQSSRFKKIKLNMSIFDMTKNVDDVIAALVLYQIEQCQLLQMRNLQEITNIAHIIIKDIRDIKEKIFAKCQLNQLTLFVFLTKLLEEQSLIPVVTLLIDDEWINAQFTINEIMIQNLVLYMYKWKMNETPSFISSTSYLNDIVTLLPAGNQCREYIQAEIEVASILSTPEHHVVYPLSNGHQYFAALQLQNLINNIDGRHLLGIDIQRLHLFVIKVQKISSDGKLSQITLHSIYEMIILRLIQCDMLKQVVAKIKNLIQIQGDVAYNYIYPSLLVAKIAPEMIDQNRNLLLLCSSYLFKQPLRLLQILNDMMSHRATSAQFKAILVKHYESIRYQNLTYNQGSAILQPLYLKVIESEEQKANYMFFLRQFLITLLSQKQQFSYNSEFYIIYIILCNDPYVLIKYLYINKYNISIKDFRCFLSYLIRQDIFNKYMTLQFGKRLFYAIYQAVCKSKNIEQVIADLRLVSLQIQMDVERIYDTKSQLEANISKSLDKFKSKIKYIAHDRERRKHKGLLLSNQVKEQKFKERLQSQVAKEGFYQYPFPDSDQSPKIKQLKIKKEDRKNVQVTEQFDPKFQRASMMGRTTTTLGLYVSIERQKFQKDIYYSQKFANDGIFGSLTIDKNIGNLFCQGLQNNVFCVNSKLSQVLDRRSRRKLRIGKVQSLAINMSEPLAELQNIMNRRSKAIVNISEDHLQQIKKVEEQVIIEAKIPEIGNIFAETMIITKIIEQVKDINQSSNFNFGLLQPYKDNQLFLPFLKELVKISFANQKLKFREILIFIKKFVQAYPIININKEWIQIYMRADALQNKFNLDLPLREILTPDGLFIQSEISDNLFTFLLPAIVSHLNQQNILKICKVITLAFKKTDLQQQILFSYLIELCNHYQRIIFSPTIDQKQLKMFKQKMGMIINKIHIKNMIGRDEEIMRIFHQEDTRKDVAQMIAGSFKKRYDIKSSDYFIEKWVRKTKNAKIE